MKVTLLVLLIVFFNVNGEELDQYRRSCEKLTIYFRKEDNISSPPFTVENPGISPLDWEYIIQYECVDKRPSNNPTFSGEEREIPKKSQKMRAKEKLIRKIEESWKEKFENILTKHDPTVPIAVIKKLVSSKIIFILGCANNTIYLELETLEKKNVTKCQDIGKDLGSTYEFYDIHPSLTYISNNKTFFIQEELCDQDVLLCYKNATISIEACSIYNIEKCQKSKVSIESANSNTSSYVRQLPDGVAVYGTFLSFQQIEDDTSSVFQHIVSSPPEHRTEKGLHYFSYSGRYSNGTEFSH